MKDKVLEFILDSKPLSASDSGDTGGIIFNPAEVNYFGTKQVVVTSTTITKHIFQKEITIKGIRFSISIGRVITKLAGIDFGKKS
jgi:hypothetical protein